MATAMRKGTVITEDQVISELIKIGLSLEVANDLSSRYYHNELTYKDLELVKMELQGNINLAREELKGDIKELDNKVDSVKAELKNEIELVRTELKNEIESTRRELKNDNALLRSETKATARLHNWMLGFNSLLTLAVLASVLGFVFNK